MLNRISAAAIAATSLFFGANALSAATIDLGFALDESGSINNADFRRAKNGLADALGLIPTSGDDLYRISVVSFASDARTIVDVMDVTPTSLPLIQQSVRDIRQADSATAIGEAIDLLTTNFTASGFGDTTLFNVTTDGVNNRFTVTPQDAATAAAAAGVDGLSFEAVTEEADVDALLEIAFPGTPMLVADADDLPNPLTTSFVLEVDNFTDYQAAISAKVSRIVADTGSDTDPISPVPLPAGVPLFLTALAAFGGMRMMRKTDA